MNFISYKGQNYTDLNELLEDLHHDTIYNFSKSRFIQNPRIYFNEVDLKILKDFILQYHKNPKEIAMGEKEVAFFKQIYPSKILMELRRPKDRTKSYSIFNSIEHVYNTGATNEAWFIFDEDEKAFEEFTGLNSETNQINRFSIVENSETDEESEFEITEEEEDEN